MSHTILVYQKFYALNFKTPEEAKEFAKEHNLNWQFVASCGPDENCPVCSGKVLFDMEHEVSVDVVKKGKNAKFSEFYN